MTPKSLRLRPSRVEIDFECLKHNWQVLRSLVGADVFLCPMVKANAYGHGDVEIARRLERWGCEKLGVGLIEEGVRLRQAGIQAQILMFGMFTKEHVEPLLEARLTPVLSDWTELEFLSRAHLERAKTKNPFGVHIKFNTGMNRLGFSVEDAAKLVTHLKDHPELELTGLCTHLASGEDAGDPAGVSEQQLQEFERALRPFGRNLQDKKGGVHVFNSSGFANITARRSLGQPLSPRCDPQLGVRPGLALYGVTPSTSASAPLNLKPVMSFRSSLVKLHQLSPGATVSYGGHWQASRPSLIGVVPAGYADGYSRHLSQRGEVLVFGKRAPVIGNVCMDYFMVDLTHLALQGHNVDLGEEIVMFGQQGTGDLSVSEVAEHAGTIPYEIMCEISERVPRVIVGDEL